MIEIKAPSDFEYAVRPWLFLAGSIEMGTAEPWQGEIVSALAGFSGTILNPRRDDWDSTWAQSITNPPFYRQVTWELDAMERADLIVMYFAPETKAPITLLEFGLFLGTGKLIVCCPDGFWRKGNVEIVCHRFEVPILPNKKRLIAAAQEALNAE